MSVSVPLLRDNAEPEDIALFSAFTLSATFWLLFSTLVGLFVSFKFSYPDWATSPFMSFGRLRAIHTNDAFYGWASVALCGAALYVAARTSGIPVAGKRFAWSGLVLFNLAAICGTITLDYGLNNGDQEYRDWVWWVTIIFLPAIDLPESPFSTILMCASASLPVTTGSPASAGNAPGTPAPLSPWHEAQFAEYTCAPVAE